MADRQVMLSYGYTVPALPEPLLRGVYGERTPDPRVEFVALTVGYYVRANATRRLTRDRVLRAMEARITSSNVYDLISLLARLGVADEFFGLTARTVDEDGAFREFLLGLDPLLIDAIRHYSAWNAIDPKLFFEGFAVGVGESFATVVVDLGRLVRLVILVQREQLRTAYLVVTDPEAAVRRLDGQATIVAQALTAVVAELDPRLVPARLLDLWRRWQGDFERHLENLDPFAAGRLLGRIAGDLWQLLTGLLALVALLRTGIKVAIHYAPLLLQTLRGAASQVAVVTRELAALLAAIGQAAVEAAPRVGMDFLRTLFPPQVFGPLIRTGRPLMTHSGLSVTMVWQAAHAEAFAGAGAGTRLGFLVTQESRPLFMAAMSETVSSAGRKATRAELDEALDAILANLDDLFAEATPPSLLHDAQAVAVKAAAAAQLAERLTTRFTVLLQTTAYEVFRELRRAGRVDPAELGRLVHTRMRTEVVRLVAETSPEVLPLTERHLRTTIREIRAAHPHLEPTLKGADNALGRTMAQMITTSADRDLILKLIGFEGGQSERALARHLKNRFGWADTTVGDLTSDLLLVDPATRRVTNVDWTSSTKLDAFEKTWGKVADDLGKRFEGNWEGLAEAYRGLVPGQVVKGVEELTAHAVRETVIRQAALRSVFGDGWYVLSHEMLYKGLNKMFTVRD